MCMCICVLGPLVSVKRTFTVKETKEDTKSLVMGQDIYTTQDKIQRQGRSRESLEQGAADREALLMSRTGGEFA